MPLSSVAGTILLYPKFYLGQKVQISHAIVYKFLVSKETVVLRQWESET